MSCRSYGDLSGVMELEHCPDMSSRFIMVLQIFTLVDVTQIIFYVSISVQGGCHSIDDSNRLPSNRDMFEVINENTRLMRVICLKFKVKAVELHHTGVFVLHFNTF